MHEPGILWWAPDLIEAYWRVGDIGAARRRLEVFRAQADATGRAWAHATAARAAGLLASTADEAEDAFATALLAHAATRSTVRTGAHAVATGRAAPRVRAARRRRTAPRGARDIRAARCAPWVAQARKLLGDDTVTPERVELTRQERQVAAIVGTGRTNREAADELFLSPRTIDFHLRNIYKKLQVRSRTELAFHLAAQDTPI